MKRLRGAILRSKKIPKLIFHEKQGFTLFHLRNQIQRYYIKMIHYKLIKMISYGANVTAEIGLKGTLTRIETSSNSGILRSKEVTGHFHYPIEKAPFTIFAEVYAEIDPDEVGFRRVTTSNIQEVKELGENLFQLETLNSTYQLKITGKTEEYLYSQDLIKY